MRGATSWFRANEEIDADEELAPEGPPRVSGTEFKLPLIIEHFGTDHE